MDAFSTYDPVSVHLLGLMCTPTQTSIFHIPLFILVLLYHNFYSRGVMLLKGCILNINILNLRLCLTHQHYTFQYAILSMVTGFVQVLENLESPGMLF